MEQPLTLVEREAGGRRIGEVLLGRGLITSEQLRKALVLQGSRGGCVGEILVGMGALTADALREVLAELVDVPVINLDTNYGDAFVLDLIPKEKAFEFKVIPALPGGKPAHCSPSRPCQHRQAGRAPLSHR